MTAPVRSASVSPFAAARPQVHSRRVSLRVGSFGLTYSTNRLLWEGLQGAATASAEQPVGEASAAAPVDAISAATALTDPSPVAPAPKIESERPQNPTESSTFPLDLEAARKRAVWAAAQEQAENRQANTAQVDGAQFASAQAGERSRATATAATASQVLDPPLGQVPDQVSAATPAGTSAGAQTGQAGRTATLAQAMRQATQAYLACAAGFACARPMLQAVA